ncbi:MAG: bile acid:sodium symporter family protein [Fermentimonas sp.]|jgi:BASS family bile acid:Na+ symporter|uniref:Bile acid:sodium symporter n=1 Tax=Fermentimonas caenicola TaxID=1562970 RepID=A0A098C214_9BACT|nr:bile acid:sodium symporter family protein [Lascolabacillus sp.]MBP6175675.1 bile acid:sodium symporter family protein [Fermentimonas sp.]MDI9626508.1 bile acid:sodium symporter family protein [Bacteroidota bacterium]TAH60977.1 MAG: bile acid:sodium symporter family protein [Fermentimonas caenicola]MBP6197629.1 bile acid:sodium symporter family protein [Fermentimonas sp.]MDD2606836.1 bile acid:sodium symporter family protein [Lascolabacillus sp.]
MEISPLLSLFGDMNQLDYVKLNFNQESVNMMNLAIAFIMFGVALSIRPGHFRSVFLNPKPVVLGAVSQYVILPALTYLLVLIIRPSTPVALGMILVSSCPGGNVSNLISSISKANITLSVSLTTITTIMSLIMTPFNFAFWGGLYAKHSPLLVPITIDPIEMFRTVFLILGVPVILGMFVGMKFPKFSKRMDKPIQTASVIFFIGFIVAALAGNFSIFLKYIHLIFLLVLVHNGLAFFSGYSLPKLLKVNERDCRTISIETGIQNSGLGLALIFNPRIFPPELNLGGMAMVAAWWGIWHIVAGLILASYWRKKQGNETPIAS